MQVTLNFPEGLQAHQLADINAVMAGSATSREAHALRQRYQAGTSLFEVAIALGLKAEEVLELAHSDDHEEATNYAAVKAAILEQIRQLRSPVPETLIKV